MPVEALLELGGLFLFSLAAFSALAVLTLPLRFAIWGLEAVADAWFDMKRTIRRLKEREKGELVEEGKVK